MIRISIPCLPAAFLLAVPCAAQEWAEKMFSARSDDYHFAQRARSRQAADGMGIEGSLAGKRVVISTDGGRLRIRKDKRGKKTKKGRSRYHTDWREPKLLVPIGSGAMESAVRRVVNLRLKGPGIFWHEEHAEQMLLLRAYYRSKPWQVLMNKAFATPLTNPA